MVDLTSILANDEKRKTFAQMLAKQSMDTSPTPSWGAGLARALQGGLAGVYEKQDEAKAGGEFDKMYGPTPGAPTAAPSMLDRIGSMFSVGQSAQTPQPAQPYDPKAMGGALSSDQSLPRGIRNNNPLNIEAGNFTQSQPGFTGSDGRFAKFEQPEQGTAAANKLLDTYQNKYGLNTVAGIVNRWAPASDGNNVSAYAQTVAKQLGVDPNQPLTPEQRPALIAAMGQHENGRPIQVASLNPSAGVAQTVQPQSQQVAQPQPMGPAQRVAPQIPPDIQARARALYIGGDKAAAAAMLQPYTTPKDQFRSLTDPAERAKFGIPAEDKNAYQVGADNKVSAINPQPFAVNVNNQGESEFSKEAAKHQAKRFDELASEGPAARQMMSDVATMRELGSKIGTGKGAEVRAAIGPYAEALGIKIDGLSDIQAFEAIANKVAPSLRVKGSGAQSDFELKNFMKSIPSLGNTPEGNDIIGRTFDGMYQNKMTASQIGSDALNGAITRAEAEKKLRELPDPMKDWREAYKTSQKAATQPVQQAAPAATTQPAQQPKAPPAAGDIQDGYRFKGGNPADPKNWEQFS